VTAAKAQIAGKLRLTHQEICLTQTVANRHFTTALENLTYKKLWMAMVQQGCIAPMIYQISKRPRWSLFLYRYTGEFTAYRHPQY
jgi:hypothetical protein